MDKSDFAQFPAQAVWAAIVLSQDHHGDEFGQVVHKADAYGVHGIEIFPPKGTLQA